MWREAIRSEQPTTEDELFAAVHKTFMNYPQQYIDNLLLSFRKRLELCVEAGGKSISGAY
jgi:hypothetical protein